MSRPPYTDEQRDALAKRLVDAMEAAIRPITEEMRHDDSVHPLLAHAAINQAHLMGLTATIVAGVEALGIPKSGLLAAAMMGLSMNVNMQLADLALGKGKPH